MSLRLVGGALGLASWALNDPFAPFHPFHDQSSFFLFFQVSIHTVYTIYSYITKTPRKHLEAPRTEYSRLGARQWVST
jgi:hypothetical protein